MMAIASGSESTRENKRLFLAAAYPVVPLPAKKSNTESPATECTQTEFERVKVALMPV